MVQNDITVELVPEFFAMTVRIFLVVFTLFIQSQAFYDGENREVRCKGEVVKHNNAFHTNFKACMEEFSAAKATVPDGERKRGHVCLMVCALTKDGIFDSTGVYQESKMHSNIDESLPPHLGDLLKQEMDTCATQHNVATLNNDPADLTCKKYKKFLRCSAAGWMKTCIDGFDPEVWQGDMED